MGQATTAKTAIAAGLILLALPRVGEAQNRPTPTPDRTNLVTITPGPQYEAGGFARAFLGSGWRDLWITPIQAPVLDLSSYAGGLELKERGGGFQSIVLHLDEEDGWREYRFRSVDKFPMQGMPPALHGTLVGRFFEDQTSAIFPAAPLLVHPLLESIGILHVKPDLYVMGDSPRLKHVRDTVAGMLGTFELKGEEGPDNEPGFAGSRSIKNTEKFFEDLASGRQHRLDEREFLAARLIDFLINDSDRTTDNFDWARFGEKGAYTWRPLPRDRDYAFTDARGLVNRFVVRRFYPKVIGFKPKYPLKGLMHSSHELDRRLLQRLTAEDFRDVALRVQRAIDNTVIARVVAELPAAWRTQTSASERLTSVLRARRDALPEVAMKFYRDLAGEVDVHGTDDPDRFDVLRHTDGRVTVTVTDPGDRSITVTTNDGATTFNRLVTSDGSVARPGERGPYFARTFLPTETNEIRLYTNGGDDVATVLGAPSGAIKVRIIGGKGDDTLADSAGGGGTVLYDADGKNVLVTASDTRVSTRPWKLIKPRSGFRPGDPWRPDWGGSKGWSPVLTYNEGAGVVIGFGPRMTSYGFRRLPHHWRAQAVPMIGTSNGRLGMTVNLDYRAENSPRLFRLSGRATQLETTRFYGYGNDTPSAGSAESLVEQTVFAVEPTLVWQVGWRSRESAGNPIRGDVDTTQGLRPLVGELRVGSLIGWIEPDPSPISRLSMSGVNGARSFGFAGARLGLELDRTDRDPVRTKGWRLNADLAGYPSLLRLENAFATATAGGSFYVPLVSDGPHLAFRAGGTLASRGYPVQFAPAIGGNSTVRGYPWHRFAGDAAVYGGTELRVPVGTVNFFVRSQLGVFGLADVGRVWFDGRSSGGLTGGSGWALHTGVGGGFWLAALGRAVSVAYARGESHRFYLKSGLSY